MSAPILFLFFNRQQATIEVFERIRDQRPGRLFLASDGPRAGRTGEAEIVESLRETIVGMVDWDCEISTLFRDANLGCKVAVSGAIDWFFQHVEEGIVLEDDCLPDPTFFRFCDELLERYRDVPEVLCVSGDASSGYASGDGCSYWLSPYPLIWGWATWRRAWKGYSVDIADDFRLHGATVLAERFGRTSSEYHFWADVLERSAQGRIDTWDYQWTWAMFKSRGLACVPNVNLIRNIGFAAGATHTSESDPRAAYPERPLEFPLRHPARVEPLREGTIALRDRVFAPGPRAILMRYGRKLKRWLGR